MPTEEQALRLAKIMTRLTDTRWNVHTSSKGILNIFSNSNYYSNIYIELKDICKDITLSSILDNNSMLNRWIKDMKHESKGTTGILFIFYKDKIFWYYKRTGPVDTHIILGNLMSQESDSYYNWGVLR
jgi:hypothetical protein